MIVIKPNMLMIVMIKINLLLQLKKLETTRNSQVPQVFISSLIKVVRRHLLTQKICEKIFLCKISRR